MPLLSSGQKQAYEKGLIMWTSEVVEKLSEAGGWERVEVLHDQTLDGLYDRTELYKRDDLWARIYYRNSPTEYGNLVTRVAHWTDGSDAHTSHESTDERVLLGLLTQWMLL